MWKLQKWRTSRSLYKRSSLLCPSSMLNEIQVMDLQHVCSHRMCLLAKTLPALFLKGQCSKIMRNQSLQEHFTHEEFPNYSQMLQLPSLFMKVWTTSSKDQLASPFLHNLHKDYTMDGSKENFLFTTLSWCNINMKRIDNTQLSYTHGHFSVFIVVGHIR